MPRIANGGDAEGLLTNPLIREVFGEHHPIAYGWNLIVQTYNFGDNYVTPTGEESIFERPDSAKERDNTQLGIGRVLMIGSAAFKAPQFKDWAVLPEVGDYVSWPKYEGSYKTHAGINYQVIVDHHVKIGEPDPAKSGYYQFIGN